MSEKTSYVRVTGKWCWAFKQQIYVVQQLWKTLAPVSGALATLRTKIYCQG